MEFLILCQHLLLLVMSHAFVLQVHPCGFVHHHHHQDMLVCSGCLWVRSMHSGSNAKGSSVICVLIQQKIVVVIAASAAKKTTKGAKSLAVWMMKIVTVVTVRAGRTSRDL